MTQNRNKDAEFLQSNKGFTLIELLVVVCIMVIAIAMASLTYGLVSNANVSRAANTLDTAFNKARVESMSKGVDAGKLIVFMQGGVLFYQISDTGEPVQVCNSMITVSTASSYADTTGTPCVGDGVIAEYTFNSAGMVNTVSGEPPKKFIFQRNNRTIETVFYLETGKHATNLL